MSEHPSNKLSPEGQDRRTRMLLELQSAMQRRAAQRLVARRAGSAAAFFLAVGAICGAVWMQRQGPVQTPPQAVATNQGQAPAPVEKHWIQIPVARS